MSCLSVCCIYFTSALNGRTALVVGGAGGRVLAQHSSLAGREVCAEREREGGKKGENERGRELRGGKEGGGESEPGTDLAFWE